jgi:hypothetical protein
MLPGFNEMAWPAVAGSRNDLLAESDRDIAT